ncbi:hypothetical protein CLOSTHATH_01885 [Hungatella hathewayi DSM 13479]|uniref:Uncharacterized protein n=1 Tax=Hungatella hathewayi DSM 13479 TaxID=566550 RepID=D3AE55_9FIRM|nr:hypothetical protein CLOSTHATH_01885 [Hungatella hathewayi DSM 13479]
MLRCSNSRRYRGLYQLPVSIFGSVFRVWRHTVRVICGFLRFQNKRP